MKNNYSLITGASSGIGLEIAKELAAKGNNILLTARREKKLIDLYQTKLWKFKKKAVFYSKNSKFEAKIFKVNLNGELVLKVKGNEMTCDNREIKMLYE